MANLNVKIVPKGKSRIVWETNLSDNTIGDLSDPKELKSVKKSMWEMALTDDDGPPKGAKMEDYEFIFSPAK
jgi:hypothetical protein